MQARCFLLRMVRRSAPASFLAVGGLLAGWIAEVPPSLCLHHHMAFLGVYLCPYLPLHKDVFSNGLNWRILVMVHEVPSLPSSMISVQFSHSVMFNSLRPHGLQHARLPCPSPTPGACSNSCPLSQWCHSTISSSIVPFSSCLQSFPASGSFQMSQFFITVSQRIGISASASVLPMNIQDWFPLGLTGWISLQSMGFWRVFSNTTVQKHQFFGTQLSL